MKLKRQELVIFISFVEFKNQRWRRGSEREREEEKIDQMPFFDSFIFSRSLVTADI